MKRLLDIVWRIVEKLYYVSVCLLILVAVIESLTWLASPLLKPYRPQLENLATSFLKRPVTIDHLTLGWSGFSPSLKLHEVIIFDTQYQDTLFDIKEVDISLNVLESILQHKLVLGNISLNNSQFNFVEEANNSWQFEGLDFSLGNTSEKVDNSQALGWIFSAPNLALNNVTVVLIPRAQSRKTIYNLNVLLMNDGVHHYLRGSANLSRLYRAPVKLALDLTGTADDISGLTGQFYFKTEKLPLTEWINSNKAYHGFFLKEGKMSVETWVSWEHQHIASVQSTMSLNNVELQSEKTQQYFVINKLQGTFFWKLLDDGGWELSGNNISIELNHHTWKNTAFELWLLNPQQSDAKQMFVAKYFQLQDFSLMMTELTLFPESFRQSWQQYNPVGTLNNVEVTHVGLFNDLAHNFHLSADFSNVGINRVGEIPGFSNISGAFNINDHSGSVQIQSHNVGLDFGKLFPSPLNFNLFRGLLEWNSTANGIEWDFTNGVLEDDNLSLTVNATLKNDSIHSLIGLNENDLTKISTYIPSTLPSSTVTWLNNAFISGDGLQANIVVSGSLKDFPYTNNKGQFLVDAKLKNADLNFDSEWPTIQHLSADLIFSKRAMFLKITKPAEIYKQKITSLTANISDFNAEPYAHLIIDSHLDLPNMTEAENIVFVTPLNATVGQAIKDLHFSGTGKLHLLLDIPLGGDDAVTQGWLDLNNNTMNMASQKLVLNDLNGELYFSNDELSSKKFTATLFDQPVLMSIETVNKNSNLSTTKFHLSGNISADNVRQYFSLNHLTFFQGMIPYNVTLSIPSEGPNNVRVESSLEGVSMDLPAPFGKPADTTHPFYANVWFNADQPPVVKLTYQNLITVLLGYKNNGENDVLNRVLLHFGNSDAQLPKTPGLFIDGQLSYFSWDIWKPFIMPYISNSDNLSSLELKKISVDFGTLRGFEQTLQSAHIAAVQTSSAWDIKIDSDAIQGFVIIPKDFSLGELVGKFNVLYLKPLNSVSDLSAQTFDPATIIALDIQANDFQYGSNKLGAIHVVLKPIEYGMDVNQLMISNNDYTLNASGTWKCFIGEDYSAFKGKFSTDNLGNFLASKDITDHITAGDGDLTFDLTWAGTPEEFLSKELKGTASFNFENGNIVDLNTSVKGKIGIGLGKVLNAISFQTLYKIFKLDFKDIANDSFDFSIMKGDVQLNKGNLTTNNFYLDGSIAELFMTGRVGIKQQDMDLNLTVKPYVGSSVPIIVGLTLTPVVGAAVWAADKLIRYTTGGVIVYSYHIIGPWSDPAMISGTVPEKS
jgi:uncharacterized protein (TIGR02099 family)